MKCSRAGCDSEAVALIDWANPNIHKDGRVKTWGACEAHEQYLIDFVTMRNFFIRSRPING